MQVKRSVNIRSDDFRKKINYCLDETEKSTSTCLKVTCPCLGKP